MKYCKLQGDIVTQVQPTYSTGFIECPEYVSCGMIKVGGAYQQPPPRTETNAEFNAQVDAELREIYLVSIPEVLKYIASKPDAPQILKDHESNAAAKRATRKP